MRRPMPAEKIAALPSAQFHLLLWLSCGYLLGIPVADVFAGVNLQTDILQRQLGKKRIGYTIAERLRLLDIQRLLGKPLRECMHWIASPQALAKAIKRHQERCAQATKETSPNTTGRPWLAQKKN